MNLPVKALLLAGFITALFALRIVKRDDLGKLRALFPVRK
jgi:hypothetical protein